MAEIERSDIQALEIDLIVNSRPSHVMNPVDQLRELRAYLNRSRFSWYSDSSNETPRWYLRESSIRLWDGNTLSGLHIYHVCFPSKIFNNNGNFNGIGEVSIHQQPSTFLINDSERCQRCDSLISEKEFDLFKRIVNLTQLHEKLK